MALYDGFFDAELNQDTYQYDREYNSGDFTGYFAHSVGSGVCIYNNVSSFLVTWDGTNAVIAPGYLFIDGHWLKNDGYYAVPLTGAGTHAVLAFLNTGARRIEIITQPKADPEVYPGCLCLAYVTTDGAGGGAVEDTRYNTEICGVIDGAGSLSSKVEYAIWYIDHEIEGKLAAAEADIAAKSAEIDQKLAEVTAMVEKLAPPPVGTVKFSASSEVEEGWLRCDGSFVSETEYPELVAALGKKYPSGDKFVVLSEGEIGQNISNGVVYGGRMWVYSHSTKKLYGVDLEGEQPIKEIDITGGDTYFENLTTPTYDTPIALSITPSLGAGDSAKIFLGQSTNSYSYGSASIRLPYYVLILGGDFDPNSESISVSLPFAEEVEFSSSFSIGGKWVIPYVVSTLRGGVPAYACCVGSVGQTGILSTSGNSYAGQVITWGISPTDAAIASPFYQITGTPAGSTKPLWREFFSKHTRVTKSVKNSGELLYVYESGQAYDGLYSEYFSIGSEPDSLYSREQSTNLLSEESGFMDTVPTTFIIAGDNKYLLKVTKNADAVYTMSRTELDVMQKVEVTGVAFPSGCRVFPDSSAYLWGKSIFLIFVGGGILFSRTLEAGSFGFLNTVDTLGLITQFGYLDYSQDENTLYLVGQDSANKVKVAKMVLNTLFDYANDGAWLPTIASDGVPAYIKAYSEGSAPDVPDSGQIQVLGLEIYQSSTSDSGLPLPTYFNVSLNGEVAAGKPDSFYINLSSTVTMTCHAQISSSADTTRVFSITLGHADSTGAGYQNVVWDSTPILTWTVNPGDTIHEGKSKEVTADFSKFKGKCLCFRYESKVYSS